MESRQNPSVLSLLVILAVILACVVFTGVAIGARDFWWFWWRFDVQPERIVITHHGQETVVQPADPEYAELVSVLNVTLPRVDRWEDLGISAGTMEEYRSGEALILEAFYAERQRIHSRFAFGHFDSLLLPLAGPHAHRQVVFAGAAGEYRSGALALRDISELRAAVVAIVGS